MPGGRPTECTPDVVEQAWEYLEKFSENGDVIPSIVGLAQYINRGKSTIYDWRDDPEKEFSDICSAILEKQESILLNKGLIGEFQQPVTKMILTKHGYADKVENVVDARVRPYENLTDDELDQEIEDLQNGD